MAGARVPTTGQVVNTQGAPAAAVAGQVLYVNKVGSDGWLQARAANGSLVPLFKYAKVVLAAPTPGRTNFKVQEGTHAGQVLSLGDANAKEYLGTKPPVQKPAQLKVTYGRYTPGWISQARGGQALDQQMATLEVEGISVQVTMNSVWDPSQGFYPIPAGTYTVLLPDTPHKADMTRFYRSVAPDLKYDQVWFPIKFGDNSRYVHVGNLSDGCTTVLDLARWPDIHEALISHRGADGKSVGTLVVTGTPERAR